MKHTTELLQSLYNQATQYALAKYGTIPDAIIVQSDGTISAKWSYYSCGSWEDDYEYFTAENLDESLEAIAEERRRNEELARIAKIKQDEENEKRWKQEAKNKRKAEYLKLKKEFE
jgi:hypothetical protein